MTKKELLEQIESLKNKRSRIKKELKELELHPRLNKDKIDKKYRSLEKIKNALSELNGLLARKIPKPNKESKAKVLASKSKNARTVYGIPIQTYTFKDLIRQNMETGTPSTCEHCGKTIFNIATLEGEDRKQYKVGTSCVKTLLAQSEVFKMKPESVRAFEKAYDKYNKAFNRLNWIKNWLKKHPKGKLEKKYYENGDFYIIGILDSITDFRSEHFNQLFEPIFDCLEYTKVQKDKPKQKIENIIEGEEAKLMSLDEIKEKYPELGKIYDFMNGDIKNTKLWNEMFDRNVSYNARLLFLS